MVADGTALVLALPNDSLDAIIRKVRESAADTVELLVADGVPALQDQKDIEKLHRSVSSRGIKLLLISSDEQTLAAARRASVETMGVRDARVRLPATGQQGNGNAYVTRKLPVVPPAPPPAPASPIIDDRDADFLRSLEEMPPPPPRQSAPASRSADDDILAALDDLSATINDAPRRQPAADYDDFAAELDAWSDVTAEPGTSPARSTPPPVDTRQQAPRRIRPEDIELTAEERRRASGVRETSRRPAPAPTRPMVDRDEFDAEQQQFTQRRPRWIIPLAVALLLILLVIVVVLVLGNSASGATNALPFLNGPVTVTLQLPDPASREQAFEPQTIPLAPVDGPPTDTAVRATVITADSTFTVNGQVLRETQAPASTASGVVTIYSQNTQPIELPQGTEFIAVNSQGQEVRFVSDAAVTLPPATTARQGAQIITTLGQAQVAITARAPGSAANVDANTIRQLMFPGQTPIPVNSGPILLEHGPITGGTEQTIRVVTDEEVQRVLGEALAGLNNQAIQNLTTASGAQNLTLERTTISPSSTELSQGQRFEYTVTPPVGQPVDLANPVFTLAVQGRFSALATPPTAPLTNQLQSAVANQLASAGNRLFDMAPAITNWRWDGERLIVEGILRPRDTNLSPQTQASIKDAIKGKSQAEAQAALEQFVQQGVISNYTLPDQDTLPGWDFLINLQVQPAANPGTP